MLKPHRYWVISPQVKGHGSPIEGWKKEICRNRIAIMGWPPDDRDCDLLLGHKFAGEGDPSVQIGDVMLIARRNKGNLDVVGFGKVTSSSKEKGFPHSDDPVFVRKLEPFIRLTQSPKGIPLIGIVQYSASMHQIYPYNKKHAKICEWLDDQLENQVNDPEDDEVELEDEEIEIENEEDEVVNIDNVTETGFPEQTTYGYKVRSAEQVKKARKVEAKLLSEYREWMEQQGHHLSALKYGELRCDAWEKKRKNLIEAKGSTSREDIRMAVGQLFDYAFQGQVKFGKPNMAILLPKEPSSSIMDWLESLDIKIIWHEGESFADNANGRFT